jgi:hypothetical protein
MKDDAESRIGRALIAVLIGLPLAAVIVVFILGRMFGLL